MKRSTLTNIHSLIALDNYLERLSCKHALCRVLIGRSISLSSSFCTILKFHICYMCYPYSHQSSIYCHPYQTTWYLSRQLLTCMQHTDYLSTCSSLSGSRLERGRCFCSNRPVSIQLYLDEKKNKEPLITRFFFLTGQQLFSITGLHFLFPPRKRNGNYPHRQSKFTIRGRFICIGNRMNAIAIKDLQHEWKLKILSELKIEQAFRWLQFESNFFSIIVKWYAYRFWWNGARYSENLTVYK